MCTMYCITIMYALKTQYTICKECRNEQLKYEISVYTTYVGVQKHIYFSYFNDLVVAVMSQQWLWIQSSSQQQ